jgi:hypothetical protein
VTRTIGFLKDNAIALVALFIALGGTSYAAVAIPKDSVGSTQLRKGAVTSSKIHSGAITPGKLSSKAFGGRILYFAEIETDGAVASSSPKGIATSNWNPSTGGVVTFPHRIPQGCFPLAGAATSLSFPAAAPAAVGVGVDSKNQVTVGLSGETNVTLAIVC